MQPINDPLLRRSIASSFCLYIPLENTCEQELKALIGNAMRVETATKMMLDGSIDAENLLEYVEDAVPDIDEYIEGVGTNLEETLLIYPWSA